MELALIYPHQLFLDHPALGEGRRAVLVEDPLFFGTDSEQPLRLHAKKLMLHRASMRRYLSELEGKGEEVSLVELPEEACRSDEFLERIVGDEIETLVVVDPVDYLLERRLRRFAQKRGLGLRLLPSPMFLTPDDWMTETMDEMKKPFMKTFYEAQRKRLNILMEEDGKPVGGKYSYDADNRKKYPKDIEVPEAYSPTPQEEIEEAEAWVQERFPDAFGEVENFIYGISRRQALSALRKFIEERFELFGDYEDAISPKHRVGFHSVLTPYLNIGLITPDEVVEAALDAAPNVPLNSLEGFIRQIIGWREFMRVIYLRHGVQERTENFWGFTRKIPASFYEGTTGIDPIDDVIRALQDDAYCHHIERLMIVGNFMMLCRFDPDEVYRWFMEVFIDAYDWVMVPNVYGMSQFADGGIFATKPYLSGSNYVCKMSDYRKGEWAKTWDGLFWTFVEDHVEFFKKNYRLAQMARLHERMTDEKKQAHREAAETFLEGLK